MWCRYMKEVAEGPRAEDYATAITFLNDAFGDLWRHRRRGTSLAPSFLVDKKRESASVGERIG